jgi:hypothetical protein
VANTIILQVSPKDVASAELQIAQLETSAIKNFLSQAAIENIADGTVRQYVCQLLSLEIPELRNRVVHHDAYRPSRAEVSRCLEDEIRFLYCLKRHFGIGTPLEHQTGQTRRSQHQAG